MESNKAQGSQTPAPNKERVKTWVEALESGNYPQAKGALRSTQKGDVLGYCCLGVGCEIFRQQTTVGSWNGVEFIVSDDEYRCSVLPPTVAAWFGIQMVPEVGGRTLVEWNDQFGANFRMIARLLRRHYLE